MSSYEFSAIGLLITHMDTPQLQTFSLSETHEDSKTAYHELPAHLRTLLVKCPRLAAFHMHSTGIDTHVYDHDPDYYVEPAPRPLAVWQPELTFPELIAPLLAHRTIRNFTASLWGTPPPYSPADLHAIAKAWPALETFRLDHGPYSGGSPYGGAGQRDGGRYADLETIVCFARHCPRLQSLRIAVVLLDANLSSNTGASFAMANDAVHPSPMATVERWPWPCTVFVAHVLCPEEQPLVYVEHDIQRRNNSLLRGWMQRVLPSATVSSGLPIRFKLGVLRYGPAFASW